MSETTTVPPAGPGGPAGGPLGGAAGGSVVPLELRGLDVRGVLDAVVERRRCADRAEAELLALVVHLVDLHPVTDPDRAAGYCLVGDAAGSAALGPVAGAGAPLVEEDTVAALGAAWGMPERCGYRHIHRSGLVLEPPCRTGPHNAAEPQRRSTAPAQGPAEPDPVTLPPAPPLWAPPHRSASGGHHAL